MVGTDGAFVHVAAHSQVGAVVSVHPLGELLLAASCMERVTINKDVYNTGRHPKCIAVMVCCGTHERERQAPCPAGPLTGCQRYGTTGQCKPVSSCVSTWRSHAVYSTECSKAIMSV